MNVIVTVRDNGGCVTAQQQAHVQDEQRDERDDGRERSVHEPRVETDVDRVVGQLGHLDVRHRPVVVARVAVPRDPVLPEVGQAAEERHDEDGRDCRQRHAHRTHAGRQERPTDGHVALDRQQHSQPDGRHQSHVGEDGGVGGVHVESAGVARHTVYEERGEEDKESEVGDRQRHQVAVGGGAHRLATEHDESQ